MVVRSGLASLPALHVIFSEFYLISGLSLNIPKTVVVPLFPTDLLEFRSLLARAVPEWGGIQVATAAKYLGIFVGPGKGRQSWEGPLAKYLQRASQWGALGLGLSMTLRAYAIYIATVLLFVAQFEEMPQDFGSFETRACRKLFPGPTCWISTSVLKGLRSILFPISLRCVSTAAVAAKSRLLRRDNLQNGGLNVRVKADELRAKLDSFIMSDEAFWDRLAWIHSWWNSSFLFQLERAGDRVVLEMEQQVNSPPELLVEWNKLDTEGVERRKKRRRRELSWQAVATQLLTPRVSHALLNHADACLRRMSMRTLPGYRAPRALALLQRLSGLVAPRVVAAYVRTIFSGWNTLKRYQQRGRCRFGCGHPADSLRHIACCPRVRAWGLEVAHLHPAPIGYELDYLLGFSSDALDARHSSRPLLSEDAILQARALHVYATYRLHNLARHNPFASMDFAGSYRGFFHEGCSASDSDRCLFD